MRLLDEFSIQMYSVNDYFHKDYKATLEKLGNKGFGYAAVEFAGYGDISAEDMDKALKANGLRVIGNHTDLKSLVSNLDNDISYAKAIGSEYILCSWADMNTKADAVDAAKKMTAVLEKAEAAGMKFGYHNHAHEFIKDDGEYLLDILFDNLPESAVMELDVYWTEHAGIDTLAFMEKNKDRLELMHIKQIDKDKNNVDLDNGLIDFTEVIKKAKTYGVKHFVLEQEKHNGPSIESVERAINYIRSL